MESQRGHGLQEQKIKKLSLERRPSADYIRSGLCKLAQQQAAGPDATRLALVRLPECLVSVNSAPYPKSGAGLD